MRGRYAGTTADDAVRLLPSLAPAAVLLTDDPDGAIRLLCTALSAPRALQSPDHALHALGRAAAHRPRWAAEQVIASRLVPGWPDQDTALAGAWATLTVGERAAVVGVSSGETVGTEAATARLRESVTHRDDVEQRDRARAAALYRRPGSAPETEQAVTDVPE